MRAFLWTMIGLWVVEVMGRLIWLSDSTGYPRKTSQSTDAAGVLVTMAFIVWAAVLLSRAA